MKNISAQSQQNISCPLCNGLMAATHTERGVFFVCGERDCGNEIPVTDRGIVEE